MKINDMAQLVNTYGFLMVFGILALVLLYKYFSKKIKNISERDDVKEMVRSDMIDNHMNDSIKSLLMHPFFYNMDNTIFLKIPNINFGDEGRTKIFQDILSVQFKIILKNLKLAIQLESITDENFLDKNLEIFKSSVDEYEKEWENYGIPDVVIKKYNGWIVDRYDYIFKSIQDISKNKRIFEDICSKQYVVLDNYNSTLSMLILDAESSLASLNGDLSGTEYKGVIVKIAH